MSEYRLDYKMLSDCIHIHTETYFPLEQLLLTCKNPKFAQQNNYCKNCKDFKAGNNIINRRMKMSTWYQLKNEDDIELSDDKKTLEVYLCDAMKLDSYWGSTYLEIPVEFIKEVMKGIE